MTFRTQLANQLLRTVPVDRQTWQSTSSPSPVHELEDVVIDLSVPSFRQQWAEIIEPDLPWADEHFAERVGGYPCNPAPSYRNWPWHSDTRKEMFKIENDFIGSLLGSKDEQPFSHTYPERMWSADQRGIRFNYGDLGDVVDLLENDPFTRQAYLPIWFPEDTGATEGQRVPCTLGYHFIRYGTQLNVKYFMRSADITRHLHNDVYMAGCLLQWVVDQLPWVNEYGTPYVGNLKVFISNLHMFTADEWRWKGTPA